RGDGSCPRSAIAHTLSGVHAHATRGDSRTGCAPVRRLRSRSARSVRATPVDRVARLQRCNPLYRRSAMARPPSNTPASLPRGALPTDWDSPLAPMRTAAELIVRYVVARHVRVGDRAQALGMPASAYPSLARDSPALFGLRENRPGAKKK